MKNGKKKREKHKNGEIHEKYYGTLRYAVFSATQDSPPSVSNTLCPLKKIPCVSNVPCHLLVLLSALCYSPLRGILRHVVFSATQDSLPSVSNPLCPLKKIPCVSNVRCHLLVLVSTLCYSPLRGILRYAFGDFHDFCHFKHFFYIIFMIFFAFSTFFGIFRIF